MHPLTFVKHHPVAVITNMTLGMIFGPAFLRTIGNITGVNVNLPSVGGNGG